MKITPTSRDIETKHVQQFWWPLDSNDLKLLNPIRISGQLIMFGKPQEARGYWMLNVLRSWNFARSVFGMLFKIQAISMRLLIVIRLVCKLETLERASLNLIHS